MTTLAERPEGRARGWVVDLATRRVIRGNAPARHTPAPGGYAERVRNDATGGHAAMSLKDLNPIDDLKGAKKLIEDAHPLKALKEALTEGAEFLDPAEADVRVVEPEPDSASEMEEPDARGRARRPSGAHPWPDQKELGKEHRG